DIRPAFHEVAVGAKLIVVRDPVDRFELIDAGAIHHAGKAGIAPRHLVDDVALMIVKKHRQYTGELIWMLEIAIGVLRMGIRYDDGIRAEGFQPSHGILRIRRGNILPCRDAGVGIDQPLIGAAADFRVIEPGIPPEPRRAGDESARARQVLGNPRGNTILRTSPVIGFGLINLPRPADEVTNRPDRRERGDDDDRPYHAGLSRDAIPEAPQYLSREENDRHVELGNQTARLAEDPKVKEEMAQHVE